MKKAADKFQSTAIGRRDSLARLRPVTTVTVWSVHGPAIDMRDEKFP
jgi:hypothetical protein